MKYAVFVMLVLPASFGYLFCLFAIDAWTAVSGAYEIEGTVVRVESEGHTYRSEGWDKTTYSYTIFVTFEAINGAPMVAAVQHGGASDTDTGFAEDAIDISKFEAGVSVPLLYHPELGHRVWLDDFWALWLIPLLTGVATVVGFLLIGGVGYLMVFT
jgi:hypothetical protein